jgi:hypothetical protein
VSKPLSAGEERFKAEASEYVEARANTGVKAKTTAGLSNSYIPTHRDETAMDGAPDRLWLVENTTTRATDVNTGILRFAQNDDLEGGCGNAKEDVQGQRAKATGEEAR